MQQTHTENSNLTLSSLIKKGADYNLWANQRLVEWLKTKSIEKMDQEVPSSFPSIRKTLLHIWTVERFWFFVFRELPTPPPLQDSFQGSVEEVFEGLVHQSEEIVRYCSGLSDIEVTEPCSLDTPWVKGTRPRFEFIHHLFNHSTYHRGQVVTIGRNVGLTDAPMTDFNFYNFLEESDNSSVIARLAQSVRL